MSIKPQKLLYVCSMKQHLDQKTIDYIIATQPAGFHFTGLPMRDYSNLVSFRQKEQEDKKRIEYLRDNRMQRKV